MHKHDFSDKSRYNRLFHQVVHKGGNSEINYINRLKNAKVLAISVGNTYSEAQLIHTEGGGYCGSTSDRGNQGYFSAIPPGPALMVLGR